MPLIFLFDFLLDFRDFLDLFEKVPSLSCLELVYFKFLPRDLLLDLDPLDRDCFKVLNNMLRWLL